jgi:tetratricopeptide (TPR) repeat protein
MINEFKSLEEITEKIPNKKFNVINKEKVQYVLDIYNGKIEEYDVDIKYFQCYIDYLQYIKKDNKAIEKYLLSIVKENKDALLELGIYYHNIDKQYELAKDCYLKYINNGFINDIVLYNLAVYYRYIEKNYELAIKYYLESIEYSLKENNIKRTIQIGDKYKSLLEEHKIECALIILNMPNKVFYNLYKKIYTNREIKLIFGIDKENNDFKYVYNINKKNI